MTRRYEMTTTLRERGKEDSIRLNFGSLYAVIKSLEKHGLIEAARVERAGNRPERVVYAITEAGKDESLDWLRELLEIPAKEYPAIETGLSLIAMLPPDEVLALLRRRVTRLEAAIEERERQAASPQFQRVPELFVVEFHFKLAMLKAERDLIAAYAARIEAGTFGGQELWAHMHQLLAAGYTMADLRDDLAGHLGEEVAALLNE
jgi:DNA-binding PadR family transcriptional regulator